MGEQLQDWCRRRGWVLAWALGTAAMNQTNNQPQGRPQEGPALCAEPAAARHRPPAGRGLELGQLILIWGSAAVSR